MDRKARLGECNKETSFKILDTFYENGGNFIDTYVISNHIYGTALTNPTQSQQLPK